jgi:pyruvate,water dikinase
MREVYVAHRSNSGEPVDFPVEWPRDEDAEQQWRWDSEHNPYPVSRLALNILEIAPPGKAATISLGGEYFGRTIYPQGFRYNSREGGGREQNPQLAQNVRELSPRLVELWEQGWRPRMEAEARSIREADYDSLSAAELSQRLMQIIEMHALHVDWMFRANQFLGFNRAQLLRFLQSKEMADAEGLTTDLLLGVPNVSHDSSVALWEMAAFAGSRPALRDVLTGELGPESLKRIETLDGGREFLDRLNAWLDYYGRATDGYGEIADPTLSEEPSAALAIVRGYLDGEDPREQQRQAAQRREAAVATVEGRLSEEDRARFRELHALALSYLPTREGRPFALNMSRGALRTPFLAAGRRLVESGVIDRPEDVFYLNLDEIHAGLAGDTANHSAATQERRAAREFWFGVLPPSVIGRAAAEEASAPDEVTGIAASAGVLTAVARLIRTPDEGHRLQPGEVLVTRSTSPAWSPLFSVAGAVVTDAGGMLSHCAIVAREFGIPAVVGTRQATSLIKDGDRVEVDGTKGVVRIER